MNTTNAEQYKNLVGKRVKIQDGRYGVVTSAGFGLISIDLDCGWWISGIAKYII